jgi:DNA-binding CsgD family transcriptional regulator
MARARHDVYISVDDRQLLELLRSCVSEASWTVRREPNASTVLVSDDLDRDRAVPRARVIEVVGPIPLAASDAARNVYERRSQGAIVADDSASIGGVLSAVAFGGVFVSDRVYELAAQLPALIPRQRHLVELLVRGQSLKAIWRALRVSPTTGKRTRHEVERQLGVSVNNRDELVARARALGFDDPPRTSP